MDKQWIVSSSPHIRTKEDTSYIMKQVILALMPATLAGLYYFRVQGLITILACVIGAVCSEWVYCKITKKKSTINDFSAVVTGLLLAFNVPAGLPIWMCVVGAIFSIIIVKMVFGGIVLKVWVLLQMQFQSYMMQVYLSEACSWVTLVVQ